MKATENSQPIKTKLHKGMLIFSCACALLLLMTLGLMIFRIVLNSELKDKLDKIRAAGYPATLAELNDYYPAVPDSENAALLYEQAFLLYNDIGSETVKKKLIKVMPVKHSPNYLFEEETEQQKIERQKNRAKLEEFVKSIHLPYPPLGERMTKKRRVANQLLIEANYEYFTQLKQASMRPKCRFSIDLSMGGIIIQPHLNQLRRGIWQLERKTVLAAENGDIPQVTADILLMLNICHALDAEPKLTSWLARGSMQTITVDNIERLINLTAFDDTSLQKISQALVKSLDEKSELLKRAFIVERVCMTDIDYIFGAGDAKWEYSGAKLIGIATLNKLKMISLFDFFFSHDINNVKAINDYQESIYDKLNMLPSIYFLAKELMQFFMPNVMTHKKLVIETKIKAAIIGIAVERYQLKYHKLPEKLTQLVPEFIKKLPNDPFTGKPFHYVIGKLEIPVAQEDKRLYPGMGSHSKKYTYENGDILKCLTRSGYMIYSYGQDGVDDNGLSPIISAGIFAGNNGTQSDISFRCVRKEK